MILFAMVLRSLQLALKRQQNSPTRQRLLFTRLSCALFALLKSRLGSHWLKVIFMAYLIAIYVVVPLTRLQASHDSLVEGAWV